MLGELAEKNAGLRDLSPREIAVFAPLLLATLWIGLYPQPFFDVMKRPVAQIVERVRPGYYVQHNLANPLVSGPSAAH
jgi:NADH-quinone oxidoreductase subunit M